jgi:hypothetical protein
MAIGIRHTSSNLKKRLCFFGVLFDISVRLHVGRPESRLVEQIVHHILKKLNYASSSDLKGLVGMDSRMKQIEALLCTQLPEVCFV